MTVLTVVSLLASCATRLRRRHPHPYGRRRNAFEASHVARRIPASVEPDNGRVGSATSRARCNDIRLGNLDKVFVNSREKSATRLGQHDDHRFDRWTTLLVAMKLGNGDAEARSGPNAHPTPDLARPRRHPLAYTQFRYEPPSPTHSTAPDASPTNSHPSCVTAMAVTSAGPAFLSTFSAPSISMPAKTMPS